METIEIPKAEYEKLVKDINLLQDQELLKKLNEVVTALYEKKYGLYMGDYTDDLTETNLDNIKEWSESGDVWNEL